MRWIDQGLPQIKSPDSTITIRPMISVRKQRITPMQKQLITYQKPQAMNEERSDDE